MPPPTYEGTRAKCDHCGATGADFHYEGWQFCCECMSALTSWFLDGGMVEAPEQFAYVQPQHPLLSSGP